ncbi:uncharacterized protein LOC121634675 isoform X2 [Melanotaenia boesemani]|uniref:uncharacterized protein LOC121634675 isoform X2 n=1 Tax=Melanotaenia boesemani TaxID=1250792 RepID=UPI001C040E4B|nr:uncharacterized protein LOC121634675 isoform X2 [Melanotaenia boesemani]
MEQTPTVYWLGDISDELLRPIEMWKQYMMKIIPKARPPTCPTHCTLKYFQQDPPTADDWIKEQPDRVNLTSTAIIIGPQGAAMSIEPNAYLTKEFEVPNSVPHITILINEGYTSKKLGPMMKEAGKLRIWTHKENHIMESQDGRFLKIMTDAQGNTRPEVILLPCDEPTRDPKRLMKEEMLSIVPSELWAKSDTDVGLMKNAQPVSIKLKENTTLPFVPQYPLSDHVLEGTSRTLQKLEELGVVAEEMYPVTNTPIWPIEKPGRKEVRLTNDLRRLNEIVEDIDTDIPNPYILLCNLTPNHKIFTVIDLCSAFHNVRLHPDSQHLFGFKYGHKHFKYLRLPQGLKISPAIFNDLLRKDLEQIKEKINSTILIYCDDILIAAQDRETCHKDSITLLTHLAEGGHRASLAKLQYCQEKVEYLGRRISQGEKAILPSQIEAITKMPKPRTVKEMMTFLGMAAYNSDWIDGFAVIVKPLRDLIREEGVRNLKHPLTWTVAAEQAFEDIKRAMQTAPTLAIADYNMPFLLYVSCRNNHACGVLAQNTGIGKSAQCIAYYTIALSPVEIGLPECYIHLAAVHLMYEKASVVTMGYKVDILTHHKVVSLLEKSNFVLTNQRILEYYRILEYPDVSIKTCRTKNPADLIPLPSEGEEHECEEVTEKHMKLRSDLEAKPLCWPHEKFFVDGSCYRTLQGLASGYAVVRHDPQTNKFEVLEAQKAQQPCSAQKAELKALIRACELAEGKHVTIYTDSAYCHSIVHLFAGMWKNRGFQRSDGSPVQHADEIKQLLGALMKPKTIAIVKCPAHVKSDTIVAKGNDEADRAAKQVAASLQAVIETATFDLEDKITIKDIVLMQQNVLDTQKDWWRQRGAQMDNEQVWRTHDGLIVLPDDLMTLLIREGHSVSHDSKSQVIAKIRNWGFWGYNLHAHVENYIARCEVCIKNNVRKSLKPTPGTFPLRGPFSELVIDFIDLIQRVQGKRYVLVAVCRFTKWVEATPTRRKSAEEVAKFLIREVIPRFGIPDRISSDNGREFVEKVLSLVLQGLQISQRLGSVYHPQSQGQVERINGVLKNKLRKICESTGLTWLDALPIALMHIRGTHNRELRLTPHELLTGRAMPTPLFRTYKGASLDTLNNELREYVKQLIKVQDSLVSHVLSVQENDSRRELEEEPKIKPGDLVYVKVFRRQWNSPRREGPYEVTRATRTAVQVKGKPTWFHLSHCTPTSTTRADDDSQRALPSLWLLVMGLMMYQGGRAQQPEMVPPPEPDPGRDPVQPNQDVLNRPPPPDRTQETGQRHGKATIRAVHTTKIEPRQTTIITSNGKVTLLYDYITSKYGRVALRRGRQTGIQMIPEVEQALYKCVGQMMNIILPDQRYYEQCIFTVAWQTTPDRELKIMDETTKFQLKETEEAIRAAKCDFQNMPPYPIEQSLTVGCIADSCFVILPGGQLLEAETPEGTMRGMIITGTWDESLCQLHIRDRTTQRTADDVEPRRKERTETDVMVNISPEPEEPGIPANTLAVTGYGMVRQLEEIMTDCAVKVWLSIVRDRAEHFMIWHPLVAIIRGKSERGETAWSLALPHTDLTIEMGVTEGKCADVPDTRLTMIVDIACSGHGCAVFGLGQGWIDASTIEQTNYRIRMMVEQQPIGKMQESVLLYSNPIEHIPIYAEDLTVNKNFEDCVVGLTVRLFGHIWKQLLCYMTLSWRVIGRTESQYIELADPTSGWLVQERVQTPTCTIPSGSRGPVRIKVECNDQKCMMMRKPLKWMNKAEADRFWPGPIRGKGYGLAETTQCTDRLPFLSLEPRRPQLVQGDSTHQNWPSGDRTQRDARNNGENTGGVVIRPKRAEPRGAQIQGDGKTNPEQNRATMSWREAIAKAAADVKTWVEGKIVNPWTTETGVIDAPEEFLYDLATRNMWYRWVEYVADSAGATNCYACTTARPERLMLVDPEHNWQECETLEEQWLADTGNEDGLLWCPARCMSILASPEYQSLHTQCGQYVMNLRKGLAGLIPPKEIPLVPVGQFECFQKWDGHLGIGKVRRSLCKSLWYVDEKCTKAHLRPALRVIGLTNVSIYACPFHSQTLPIPDTYWYCGGTRLLATLPEGWIGRCARVQTVADVTIVPVDAEDTPIEGGNTTTPPGRLEGHRRHRRALQEDPRIWFSSIGQPKGIPEQFKVRNEVAVGFEALMPIVSIIKTTEWLNYVFFTLHRFANATDDALSALGEQLSATSIMTLQNRQALDWLLAAQGGVCHVIGTKQCCTFIPDVMSKTGEFTRAMATLKGLKQEMTKATEGQESWGAGLSRFFDNWEVSLLQWFTGIAVSLLVMAFALCCCIPVIRTLVIKAVTKQMALLAPRGTAIQTEHDGGTLVPPRDLKLENSSLSSEDEEEEVSADFKGVC